MLVGVLGSGFLAYVAVRVGQADMRGDIRRLEGIVAEIRDDIKRLERPYFNRNRET
jgi:hypothetical protein